jgi:hypothetical protein
MWSPLDPAEDTEEVESSAKLTKRIVDSAVPKQGRYILWPAVKHASLPPLHQDRKDSLLISTEN